MIQKQYDGLRDQTVKITASLLNLLEDLDKVMDCEAKDFVVTYKNKVYDLHKPIDLDESIEQKLLRRQLSIALTERCIKIFFKHLKKKKQDMDFSRTWEDILCFAMGEDPKDHRFEKYEEEEIYSIEIGEDKTRSIPLDFDNYQVKNDLGFLDQEITDVEQSKSVDSF